MIKKLVLFSVLLSSLLLTVLTAHAQKQYTFGVHPFKNPTQLKTMFSPLTDYLGQQLGAEVSFRSAKDYDTALQALVNGEVDISYMGPSLYAIANEQHPGKISIGAVVLNNGKPTFQGVIIAKDDSSINSIADLQGKNFAFGDRESTLSCYIPAHMMMQAGVFDSVTYKFLGSHDNVAKAVQKGIFDAGGIKPGVAKNYVGKGVKIIATSDPVYEHLIVFGPNVDAATQEKIRNALLNVTDANVYTSINSSLTGFATVQPSDYDNLKEIMKAVDAKIPQ